MKGKQTEPPGEQERGQTEASRGFRVCSVPEGTRQRGLGTDAAPGHGNDTLYCEDDNTVTSGGGVNVSERVSDEFEPRFRFNLDVRAKAKTGKTHLGENEDTKPTRDTPGGTRRAGGVTRPDQSAEFLSNMDTPRGPRAGGATGSLRPDYSESL